MKIYTLICRRPFTNCSISVCSAGITGTKAEPDHDTAGSLKEKLWNRESFEEWNETYNTDVTAVYFTTVAFLPLLQAGTEKRGHLTASTIVISSMSGIMRHAQGHFSYNAAKGATVQLTRLMSAEFQKLGVRINSIAPGYFPSEMTAKESRGDQKSELPAEKVQEKGHVPAQRPGTDEEMAQAVVCYKDPVTETYLLISSSYSLPKIHIPMARFW